MQITSKVLIIGRSTWNDSAGDAGTWSNLFHGAQFDNTAYIYIESAKPTSRLCRYFYQISEISLVKKLFRWRLKTGNRIDLTDQTVSYVSEDVIKQENATMNFVRGHRSPIFTWARECLWALGLWKSKDLDNFISEFKPDVIFFFGSPLILMNKLASYVIKKANKPAAVFLMDDAYTYVDSDKGLIHHFYKSRLRQSITDVVHQCEKIYVISPKMKEEYDKAFGIDSVFITKGIDFSSKDIKPVEPLHPIKMVYMGQVIYGRLFSLLAIADKINSINADEVKIEFDVYTMNTITDNQRKLLSESRGVHLMKPVHPSDVDRTISKYDVVVFVESFDSKYKDVARLSFSTKLTDYLGSGKCIFAVGPENIAPIEYLRNDGAAIVASSLEEIDNNLQILLQDDMLKKYAESGVQCGKRNHSRERIDEELYNNYLNKYSI